MSVVTTRVDDHAPARTVRFGRRSSRGVLMGLSGPRLAAVGVAFLIALPAVYAGGVTGLLYAAPLWAGVGALAFVDVAGRKAAEWVPVYGHWIARRALRQDRYLVRVHKPRPAGTLALPGDAACLRLVEDAETGAAMIHDPYAKTLTVIGRLRQPSFLLLADAEQERRVEAYGRFFATCCQSGRIARVQLLERTVPDAGTGVRTWWQQHGVADQSWAPRNYAQLVADACPEFERHDTTLSVSLNLSRARHATRGHGRGMSGAAVVLRQEMATIAAALRSAEIQLDGWLGPGDLASVIRSVYDPAMTSALQVAEVGAQLTTAGPVVVEESFDHLRTDSGYHAVLWVSEWPRTEVYPSFLSPLLLTARIRRTLSIVAQPLGHAEAVRSLRKERVEYQTDAAERSKIGQLTDLAAEQEWADVTQRERDLISGHGELRYAGMLTITAATVEELHADQAAVAQAAIQAGCETRLLRGQQAQAFAAAALPLGRGL